MRTAFSFLTLLLIGLTTGCSSRTGYDMLRLHQEQRCMELQGADRDACMRQSETSYDEYQRKMKEQ